MPVSVQWAEGSVDPQRLSRALELPVENAAGGRVMVVDHWLQIEGQFAESELRELLRCLAPCLADPPLVLHVIRRSRASSERGQISVTRERIDEIWGAAVWIRDLLESRILRRPLTEVEQRNLRDWSDADDAFKALPATLSRKSTAFGLGRPTPRPRLSR